MNRIKESELILNPDYTATFDGDVDFSKQDENKQFIPDQIKKKMICEKYKIGDVLPKWQVIQHYGIYHQQY